MRLPDSNNAQWRKIASDLKTPSPEFIMKRVMGTWISIIPAAIDMFTRAVEAEDIKNGLDPVKIGKIETMLSDWQAAIEKYSCEAESAFDALGIDVLDPDENAPISRSDLRQQTRETLANIGRAKESIATYKNSRSTDNLFLQRQRQPRKNHSRIYNWWTKSA